jgi:hypothetical protein
MTPPDAKPSDLKRVALWAAGLTLLILFGLLVWPTLYRYDHIDLGLGRSYPVRQNRFNGQTEILFPDGWKDSREASAPSTFDLTPDQLSKVEVTPKLNGSGPPRGWNRVEADVYNGLPDTTVTEITLDLTVVGSNNEPVVTSRRYRLVSLPEGEARALQTGNYSTSLGFSILPSQSWSYVLVGAKGKKN